MRFETRPDERFADGRARLYGKSSYSFAWNPSLSEWAETQRMIYMIWPSGFRSHKYIVGILLANYPATGYYVRSPYPDMEIGTVIDQIGALARVRYAQFPHDENTLGARKQNINWIKWIRDAAQLYFSWDEATRATAHVLTAISGPEIAP